MSCCTRFPWARELYVGEKQRGKINMKPDWPILDRNGEAVSGGGGRRGGGAATAFPYHVACGSASLSLSEITCHACKHGCHRRCCKRPTQMNGCNWSVECGDGLMVHNWRRHLTTLHSSLWLFFICYDFGPHKILVAGYTFHWTLSAVFFLRKFSNAAKVAINYWKKM
jgi:hypothetical protein